MQVSVNLTVAKKKLSQSNVKRGRFALANQAMADMNQFVPMREGILRQTATIDIDGGGVNYNTPYAKAQFYGKVGKGGYPVRNYTTPGTGPRWDLKAKPMFMSDWIKAFIKGADW
ncbi:minor capsid protein [Bacillus sp. FSL W8-1122]